MPLLRPRGARARRTQAGLRRRSGASTRGASLRAFAARGVLVNSVFDIGLGALSLVQGLIVAALLTRSDVGVWGVLVVSLGVLARLKLVGIGDKYIQQQEADQELAFQKAFTLEVLMATARHPVAPRCR